jgi:hypothetical protein
MLAMGVLSPRVQSGRRAPSGAHEKSPTVKGRALVKWWAGVYLMIVHDSLEIKLPAKQAVILFPGLFPGFGPSGLSRPI